jgi:hypothetical protein
VLPQKNETKWRRADWLTLRYLKKYLRQEEAFPGTIHFSKNMEENKKRIAREQNDILNEKFTNIWKAPWVPVPLHIQDERLA